MSISKKNKIVAIGILAVLLGALLIYFLTSSSDSKHDDQGSHAGLDNHGEEEHTEIPKGPHGGKLFEKDGLTVELCIYESGVPPEFRMYVLHNNSSIDLRTLQASVTLYRLATEPEKIVLTPKEDYLVGDKEIYEPHSFKAAVSVTHLGKEYQWEYEQLEGRVELSSEAITSSGIKSERATSQFIESTIELVGEVKANENALVRVMPLARGYISDVKVNLGDNVRKGQLLAVIQSRELAEIKGEYLSSEKHLELAQAEFTRSEELWKKQIISEKEFFAARQEKAGAEIKRESALYKLLALGLSKTQIQSFLSEKDGNLARYELRAPMNGVIIEKKIVEGNAITSDEAMNSPLMVIADMSTVWVMLSVPMNDVSSIKPGQQAVISIEGSDISEVGKIVYVDPILDEATRTAKARVVMSNGSRKWKAGMFVKAKITMGKVQVPLAVRLSGLQTFRDWNVVFLRDSNTFEIRPIEFGKRDKEWVEVVSGLRLNDEYVTENSYLIKADIEKSGATHDH